MMAAMRVAGAVLVFMVWLSVTCPTLASGDPKVTGKSKSIEVEKQDDAVLNDIEGLNVGVTGKLYEADIVLSDEDKRLVDQREEGDADGPGDGNVIKRNAVRNRQKLWKTRVLPYRISPALYRARSVIMAAIKEFHRHTCLRFRPRKKEPHWIFFVKRPGCWSSVGQKVSIAGPQLLSVGPGCDKKGIIMHELMHAAGFWHEQSRTDRNKYVEVLWENVAKGQAHNFNKYPHGKLDYLGAMYDFQSLMHYGSHAFSKNGKRTIKAIKQPSLQFGQRKSFSETDIQQLNALYDCKISSTSPHPEQRSLISEDDHKLNGDYGATQGAKTLPPSDELSTKLDILERVLENQRKFLEDHDVKIQEIENVISKLVTEQEEKQKQTEPDAKFNREAVFHDFHVDEEQAESRDPWKKFEHHAQILKLHEERLEKNTTKIEIIREMLEDTKGDQENEGLKQKLSEYKQQLKRQRESYERLKIEVEEQLQIQQKLQDNMLAGFIVGFVILVLICMLPRTLLTSG